jgi:hypothetical protein
VKSVISGVFTELYLHRQTGYRRSEVEGCMSRRDQLLRQANQIQESSNRLKNIQTVALENENIGSDILTTLRGQRETLERSRDEVRIIQSDKTSLSHPNIVAECYIGRWQRRRIMLIDLIRL